jgi:hypothetical protein
MSGDIAAVNMPFRSGRAVRNERPGSSAYSEQRRKGFNFSEKY